jgi:hypothetical protein
MPRADRYVEGDTAVMQMPLWRFEPLPAGMVARATVDAPAPIQLERALYEQLKSMHAAAPLGGAGGDRLGQAVRGELGRR